ncbi:hypothetical protein DFH07DRAFT_262018 [Mycena maculata]|uniref:Uncharacterized protein n=1 Tax=Mycena maculata TaxID=230809 RepID=A0AAD7HPQ2_9AGAR|nr:hypothetical protein DFH07DRAFT_262018 [Mycena maculata]
MPENSRFPGWTACGDSSSHGRDCRNTSAWLDELTRKRAVLTEFVDAHLELVSPARRLPLDIVHGIFLACLPSGQNSTEYAPSVSYTPLVEECCILHARSLGVNSHRCPVRGQNAFYGRHSEQMAVAIGHPPLVDFCHLPIKAAGRVHASPHSHPIFPPLGTYHIHIPRVRIT